MQECLLKLIDEKNVVIFKEIVYEKFEVMFIICSTIFICQNNGNKKEK